MISRTFTHQGIKGLVEFNNKVVFIHWGGMGFHLASITNEELRNKVLEIVRDS